MGIKQGLLTLHALIFAGLFIAGESTAFISNGRWSSTATEPTTSMIGNPITLTWSLVPDGTNISHLSKPSDLVAFLDGIVGAGPGGSDYQLRPWFPLLQSSFNRWSEVSGMTFVYEPADDGVSGNRWHGSHPGVLGARGDVRLGGAFVDGIGGSYASAGFIPNADITIDTGDLNHYQNANGNYINLRNTLTHEIGHSLGLSHAIAPSATYEFLMEGEPKNAFDGPQIDDIRGIQYLYGDKYEKNGGNNSLATAFDLGEAAPGSPIRLGLHSTTGTRVEAGETDFASIANANDVDFFKFETTTPTLLDLVLTPAGSSYQERVPPAPLGTTHASMQSNLSLELYADGELTPIAVANLGGMGQAESILGFELAEPGSYIARIVGDTSQVQLYSLEILVTEIINETAYGDFNDDGIVDAADYTIWRDHLGEADDSSILDRGDGVAGISVEDYEVWKSSFGLSYEAAAAVAAQTVPEASAFANIFGAAIVVGAAFSRGCRSQISAI
jgi:serralysin